MLAYLTLLYDPSQPELTGIEEPKTLQLSVHVNGLIWSMKDVQESISASG
jgi:hypothetical protein